MTELVFYKCLFIKKHNIVFVTCVFTYSKNDKDASKCIIVYFFQIYLTLTLTLYMPGGTKDKGWTFAFHTLRSEASRRATFKEFHPVFFFLPPLSVATLALGVPSCFFPKASTSEPQHSHLLEPFLICDRI